MLDTLPLELLNMILSNVSSESVLGVEPASFNYPPRLPATGT